MILEQGVAGTVEHPLACHSCYPCYWQKVMAARSQVARQAEQPSHHDPPSWRRQHQRPAGALRALRGVAPFPLWWHGVGWLAWEAMQQRLCTAES